jgi:hypothetical protein
MRVNKHMLLGVLASAVALTGTAVTVPAALATSGTHTLVFKTASLKLVSHAKPATQIGANSLSKGGTVVGLDVANCRVTVTHGEVHGHCKEAYSVPGGLIYARYASGAKGASGVITGGTGKFTGVTGTMHAVFEKNHRHATVTLKYHK